MAHIPPSPLRVILSILLGLIAPPLGLVAWIALSGPDRREYMQSAWIRAGAAICAVSAVPLLIVIAAASLGLTTDPNPNPIGLGLLFLTGGVTATAVVAVGVIRVDQRMRLSRS